MDVHECINKAIVSTKVLPSKEDEISAHNRGEVQGIVP